MTNIINLLTLYMEVFSGCIYLQVWNTSCKEYRSIIIRYTCKNLVNEIIIPQTDIVQSDCSISGP